LRLFLLTPPLSISFLDHFCMLDRIANLFNCIVLLALLTCTNSLASDFSGQTVELEVSPREAEKFAQARYRLWLPENTPHLRAIIVRQHGCGRNGIDHADDLQWQALAQAHSAALLGTHLQPRDDCSDWWNPANGSERAFLAALEELAAKANHPELKTVPWAIWGHSGGSLWAISMAYRQPERVIAVFGRSGALADAPEAPLGVPMILNYGAREKTGRFEKAHLNSVRIFEKNQPRGALLAIAVDPKSEHDCGNSRQLAIPYFAALLKVRLPEKIDPELPPRLRAINAASGWLANGETLQIAAAKNASPEFQNANWLPDEHVAKAWKEYAEFGAVADTTPPPPPKQAVAKRELDRVTLTWQLRGDLESSLAKIHVYRQGEKIATFGSEPSKENAAGHLQSWNYGDEPEPRAPLTSYTLEKQPADAEYSLSMENAAGLESEKVAVKVASAAE
jgi:pimeloyl-ACP methyl ester carboxylesterase